MPGSRVRLFTSLMERQKQRGLPSDEAIQGLVDAVARAMETEVATLYVLDAGAGELVLAATRGLARSGVGFVTLKLGEGISGTSALRGAPVSSADVSSDPAFRLIPGFDQSRYRSILAVPILRDAEVVGALNVQTTDVRHYTEADVQDLAAMARAVAESVKRAWCEGDLALRLRGPTLLSSVDGLLAASLGPAQICEQVASSLNAILPDARCVVAYRLLDELRLTPTGLSAPVLLSALTASVASGEAVELESGDWSILALPLQGRRAVFGGLALSVAASATVPWRHAHVRRYLDALAERVGLALEPLMARLEEESRPASAGSSLYAGLVDLVLQDRGLETVVEAAATACNAEIAVVDVFDGVMAGSLPADSTVDVQLTAGGQVLGRMLASASRRYGQDLETVAQVVSLELAKSKARFEVEGQLRGDVLELLLAGAEIEKPELQARMTLIGLDPRREYVPVVFAFDSSTRLEFSGPMATHSLMRIVRRTFGGPPDAVAFHRPEGLLVLAGSREARLDIVVEKAIEEFRFLARLTDVGTGIGSAARRPSEYAAAIKKATLAATLALRIGMDKPVTSDRLGVHGLLLTIADTDQLREYVQAQLGPLFSSDEKSGGDLTRTLEAYHTSGERLSDAARLLSVHVNTLKYRLARIESLTGRSLRDPIARFNMYVALYALRLVEPGHKTVIPDEIRGLNPAAPAGA